MFVRWAEDRGFRGFPPSLLAEYFGERNPLLCPRRRWMIFQTSSSFLGSEVDLIIASRAARSDRAAPHSSFLCPWILSDSSDDSVRFRFGGRFSSQKCFRTSILRFLLFLLAAAPTSSSSSVPFFFFSSGARVFAFSREEEKGTSRSFLFLFLLFSFYSPPPWMLVKIIFL